jgi:hypothetical protein
MRMQPDAATRPQDRAHFGAQIQSESHLDLGVRHADAQNVGRCINATASLNARLIAAKLVSLKNERCT